MRIFKTKLFARFARRERINDDALREAVERVEKGLVDADLGGGDNSSAVGHEAPFERRNEETH